MAQNYLCGGDFAKGIIAKINRQSCHPQDFSPVRGNFDFNKLQHSYEP
jgi:hypothetical protein